MSGSRLYCIALLVASLGCALAAARWDSEFLRWAVSALAFSGYFFGYGAVRERWFGDDVTYAEAKRRLWPAALVLLVLVVGFFGRAVPYVLPLVGLACLVIDVIAARFLRLKGQAETPAP